MKLVLLFIGKHKIKHKLTYCKQVEKQLNPQRIFLVLTTNEHLFVEFCSSCSEKRNPFPDFRCEKRFLPIWTPQCNFQSPFTMFLCCWNEFGRGRKLINFCSLSNELAAKEFNKQSRTLWAHKKWCLPGHRPWKIVKPKKRRRGRRKEKRRRCKWGKSMKKHRW